MTIKEQQNTAQKKHWNDQAGAAWVQQADLFDYMFAGYGDKMFEHAPISTGDRVLDIGCGSGATTFTCYEKVGKSGTVLGLDISQPLIELARQRAVFKKLPVTFTEGDAATWKSGEKWHGVVSRFGTMFFDDPIKAFINIRQLCTHGSYLSMACWGSPEESDMTTGIMNAVSNVLIVPPIIADPDTPGPYSFSNPERVKSVLIKAGWSDITFNQLDTCVPIPGKSLQESTKIVAGFGAIARLAREQRISLTIVAESLEAFLASRVVNGVVQLRAPAHIITARTKRTP